MDSPPEGHIPSGTSQSEVLSPCLLRQREDVRFCIYNFGKLCAYVACSLYRYRGVSKGVTLDPFRWKSKNQEVFGVLFVKLSSHKKVSAGAGCVSPQKILQNVCMLLLAESKSNEKGFRFARKPLFHAFK